MYYRSWLFVPGDSEIKLGKAVESGADAVIVDLEATVAGAAKPNARQLAARWLAVHRHKITEQHGLARWVRINALDSRLWRDDLVSVMQAAPDGIVLPKATGPEAVRQLAAELYEQERLNQIPAGSTKIMPMVGETPHAGMTIGAYLEAPHQRLAGLTWDAEDLSIALGTTRKYDAKSGWAGAFEFVRAQTLLAAHACGVIAVETLHAEVADDKLLKAIARDARADGFAGMLAIDPTQVPVINEAFTPTGEELEKAREIVDAFAANPGAGVLQIDRRMIDQPRLNLARRMLGLEQPARDEASRATILRPA